jgi:hypothetical protein
MGRHRGRVLPAGEAFDKRREARYFRSPAAQRWGPPGEVETITASGEPWTSTRTRRHRLLGAAACSLLLIVAVELQGVRAARAQGAPQQAGIVTATTASFGEELTTSNLPLAVQFGQATAAYNQTESQASSSSVDLGGLGSLLGDFPICGMSFITSSELPQPMTADSANGPSSTTGEGNVPGLGTESVTVSATPLAASATTTPTGFEVPGLLDLAAVSTSSVRYVAGQEQDADATTTAQVSLLGGEVLLNGLTWSASDHAGASETKDATFSLGSVAIPALGIDDKIPPSSSLQSIVDTVNVLLSAVGVSIVMPGKSEASLTNTTSIGPLDIRFRGSALMNTLFAPVTESWVNLADLLTKEFPYPGSGACTSAQQLVGQLLPNSTTLVNLLLGILQGDGEADIVIGGASVSTEPAPAYVNPFGTLLGGLGSSLASPVTPTSTLPTGVLSSTTPPAPATQRALGSAVAGVARCGTTSPAGAPGCWNGLATVAGAVALSVGGGLLAADLTYGRRRRHRRHARGGIP